MGDDQLGIALVEARVVSSDQLALALSDLVGTPPALAADFARADPELRKRLGAHQAAGFKCIPLYATARRRVAVAMVDPQHPELQGELAFVLGAAVEPMVTSAVEHGRQLELLYGLPRRRPTGLHPVVAAPPSDYGVACAVGQERAGGVLLPFRGEGTPALCTPRPRPRSVKQTQSYAAVAQDMPMFVPAAGSPARRPPKPVPAAPAGAATDRAVEQILASPDLQTAADRLFLFMRACFGAGAMFVVNGIFAQGRFGYCGGAECPAVESLVLSLTPPSALRMAHSRRRVFHGTPPAEGESIHGPLWAALRCSPPPEIVVAPVVAGGAVSLLLYAHGPVRVDGSSVSRMVKVCSALGNTLVRLAG